MKRDNKQTEAQALLHELSMHVAKVKDACMPLNSAAAAAVRRKPSLQVMFFGAAALTQGWCALSRSYPIATR